MSDENTHKPAPQSQSRLKRTRVRGASKLSKACERILRRHGDQIAETLFRRACEGNVSSTRLLLKIIELEARSIRMRRRQAEERRKLAAKPQQ